MSKIGLLLLFSLLIFPLRFFLMSNDHRRIKLQLKRRQCEALEISWHPANPLTSRSGAGFYEVLYVNAKNELYRARCIVESYATLYWTESIFLYVASPERIERLRRFGGNAVEEEYVAKSEKEKVVDGLTSSFKYERLWAIKSLADMKKVDAELVHLVNRIALEDSEFEVSEAAKEFMNKLQVIEEG